MTDGNLNVESINNLINQYEAHKGDIPENFKEFFNEYILGLEKQKSISRSLGDRNFILRNFKKPLRILLENNGYQLFEEVNLYKPKTKIKLLDNIVKDKFKDFKNSKKIDFIALKQNGLKKIIFIEIKMKITSSAMLSGLFELSMIDSKKIPSGYEIYLVLLSGYARNPKKYPTMFEVIREIFFTDNMKEKCRFVLLDPKRCIGENWFHNIISV